MLNPRDWPANDVVWALYSARPMSSVALDGAWSLVWALCLMSSRNVRAFPLTYGLGPLLLHVVLAAEPHL